MFKLKISVIFFFALLSASPVLADEASDASTVCVNNHVEQCLNSCQDSSDIQCSDQCQSLAEDQCKDGSQ